MKPDVVIEVRFKTTSEGGRQDPIVTTRHLFGCPVFIDGEAFDCRILLEGKTLELGGTYKLPIKFLFPDLALPKLSVGKSVTLWEGKDIAIGKVLLIGPLSSYHQEG
jgi:hypothetical protein